MSDFNEFINEGLADSIAETGETVTFRGVTYTADVGELTNAAEFILGGEAQRKSCAILLPIPATPFDPEIRTHERILTGQGELEIVTIGKDSIAYQLQCAEVARKK